MDERGSNRIERRTGGREQGGRIFLCRHGLHSCDCRQISVVEDWTAVASSHGLGLPCVVPFWAPF